MPLSTPSSTERVESVRAFDTDADPRAVRFRTADGETWWLSPPMDGGPRFLRREQPADGAAMLLALDLMREEGEDPSSLPLAVGQALFARIETEDSGTFLIVTDRVTGIDVLGRPIVFRRPGDA